MQQFYQLLADAVLILHTLIVVFIVVGLLLILIGGVRKWTWIVNPWFRVAHLVGIGTVVLQAWLGVLCPLTTLEMWLRQQAGSLIYRESFIQYWLQKILFYQAPLWVFAVAYTAFALLVLMAWLKFPPRFKSVKNTSSGS
ncbi:MAG: DUF2784 domain-containing protein [Proteobacteria bacterium]|nr:DUF2784 domain-containing protein [Pseudomonadota bacterium]